MDIRMVRAASLMIVLILTSVIVSTPGLISFEGVALSSHDPIEINFNDGFTAENGVVGGSGTAEDPYILSGYRIEAPGGSCISISYTDAHVVIENMSLHERGQSPAANGIWLYDVANCSVRNCEITNCAAGAVLFWSKEVEMTKCHISNCTTGIAISWGNQDITVTENRIEVSLGAISFVKCGNVRFYHNDIYGPRGSNILCLGFTLDNGYPDGGNYWDTWKDAVDKMRGPEQNLSGEDGIADSPLPGPRYGWETTDMYPLMHPWIEEGSPAPFIAGVIIAFAAGSALFIWFSRRHGAA